MTVFTLLSPSDPFGPDHKCGFCLWTCAGCGQDFCEFETPFECVARYSEKICPDCRVAVTATDGLTTARAG
jgi:hypothetical protein